MSSQKNKTNTNTKEKEAGGQRKHQQQQQQNQPHLLPTIPFGRNDRILLIGEGDFSFARSLVEHHRCRYILATCYDSKEVLHAKYPQAEENVNRFLGAFAGEGKNKNQSKSQDKDDDEGKQKPDPVGEEPADEEEAAEEEKNGDQPSPEDAKDVVSSDDSDDKKLDRKSRHHRRRVLFSVDARKLGTAAGGGKEVRNGFPRAGNSRNKKKNVQTREHSHDRKGVADSGGAEGGPWDIICFNFPHVGGLSTDVNRQVRANQELLVAFFKACVPLLSSSVPTEADDDDDDDDQQYTDSEGEEEYNTESESSDSNITDDKTTERNRTRTLPKTRGQILVTLFEGEPYTLWNIRDLARHAGLRVVTSFRFPWKSYPGYSHARTLGVVESRSGRKGGGWKGEDREARTYVFEVKGEDTYPLMGARKRAREDDSSDDDD
ncbi:hypothetical protein VTN77DRAFT_897 [Rasamsonia byssochlamydoides]|uniref:uncharacterized protein n=1 Tax=Rasamsonia byssochlamydoides TaxID=89139 RepID=UPI0037440CEC